MKKKWKETCRTKSNGPVSRWNFTASFGQASCWRTPSTSGFFPELFHKLLARGRRRSVPGMFTAFVRVMSTFRPISVSNTSRSSALSKLLGECGAHSWPNVRSWIVWRLLKFSLGLLHLGEKSSNGKTWMDLKRKHVMGIPVLLLKSSAGGRYERDFYIGEVVTGNVNTEFALKAKKKTKKVTTLFRFTFGQRRWESQHFSILPDSSIVDENEIVANYQTRWSAY